VTVLLTAVNLFGNRCALRAGRYPRGTNMMYSPERMKIIARPRHPDWFPSDAQIIRCMGSHQALYRFHKPLYQLQLIKDLAMLLPPGDCRILDIGAGSGLVAEMIASMFPGKTVVAVDVTNRILPTVGVPFRLFDGQTLPFEDDSFDCALFCNVLHHVKTNQRRGLLDEALRVTRRTTRHQGSPGRIRPRSLQAGVARFRGECPFRWDGKRVVPRWEGLG